MAAVWIDTDMGFDDLAATLIVLHQDLELAGMSLVLGNAPMAQVAANAAAAAKTFGWDFPIYEGRDRPVLGRIETAQHVLGATGIRTVGRSLPAAEPEFPKTAFDALSAWLATDGPHRILALGPLTNIAALALAYPQRAAAITELVWMGGGVTTGNHTASAEFNAYADPEAVAIVLAHGIPLRMVDLDLCRKVIAKPDDVAPVRAAGGANAELLADLLAGFIEIGTSRGRPGMALYDPSAAVAFARPELVHYRQARIEVELAGALTRGRTVVDVRPTAVPNASYADDIDAEAALRVILDALVWAGRA
ncbi:MAG TPA: nucleoside hydrolase [Devosiaceae bacterium]|nr:nucleoside hydrolase [Devosiaceae bacterium]